MKKILIALLSLLLCLSFVACGDGEDSEETTAETDWRNTIEYESAFFVNEQLRLLYALDTGSITLWDSAGKGEIMQVIEYDTSVADAIERIEKEDFNGDGNCDIRIIYSESDVGNRYTLWLWSTKTEKFAECKLYATLTDPVIDEETGNVVGVDDLGVFGTVTRVYAFNETSGLDEVSVTMSDPEATAKAVAEATVGGELRPAEGKTSIEDVECTVYISSADGKDVAYIAHTPDSVWYIDEGCLGFYRTLEEKDGKIVTSHYAGEAKAVEEIAVKISEQSIRILSSSTGVINGAQGVCYSVETESGEGLYLVHDEKGYWYHSEDGEVYHQISAQSGEPVGSDEFEFALPEEE